VHAEGAKVAIQLFHAGRQTSSAVTGTQPVGPSPIPDPTIGQVPRELSVAEIQQIEEDFAAAARRAAAAGFDAVEVHGAHGYLIAAFLSPFSNRRVDEYGGGIRGRARFALEVVQRVRQAVGPEYPILFRLSAEERVEGGLTIDQTRVLAPLLEQAGVDALHVSVGNYATPGGLITAPMDVERGFLVPLVAEIKRVVSVPVIAVDRLHDPLLAEQVLAQGEADLIAIGRGLLTDPDLPEKARRGALDEILPCIACNQACIAPLMRQQPVSCLLNPRCGRERELAVVKADRPRRVIVVGGGPAGLEAARVLAERGHAVHLLERESRLGGEFLTAAIPPRKEEIADALRWMIGQVYQRGVAVELGVEATPEVVLQRRPEAVVVATGGKPVRLPVPGIDREEVVFAREVLLGLRPVGQRVLVIGGGPVGLETAEFLVVQRKLTTVVEMTETFGVGLEDGHRYWVMDTLRRHEAALLPRTIVESIEPGGVVRVRCDGRGETLGPFDTIVLAAGYRPRNELYHQLRGQVAEMYLVGDALQPRSAVEAVLEAARTALAI
jgi:2,4-dienoyl-CoA reductase-like NADH-dependent reductase (Old Yellow Enzyme family)/thioredoxin reductase